MQIDEKVKIFADTLSTESTTYRVSLSAEVINRIADYYQLVEHWNARLHLVAPCTPEEFATRHVLESLFLINYLSQRATVTDVGSGAGLPLIPCLMARPDLTITLIESSQKKTVFLREALKLTRTGNLATVVAERFENVSVPESDFVTCRALDHFVDHLDRLIEWSPLRSVLLLYGGHFLGDRLRQLSLTFKAQLLPNSSGRFLFIVRRD